MLLKDLEFIERFFDERAVYFQTMKLLRVADTVELLEHLEKHQLKIGGIDGLQLVRDGIRPDQELFFDFDQITVRDTIEAIKHLDESHRFELLF